MTIAQHYKILAGTFALRRFTIEELAHFSEVELETIKSWLKEHENTIVSQNKIKSDKQEHTDTQWLIKENAEEEVYQNLKAQWSQSSVAKSITQETETDAFNHCLTDLPSLDTVEGYLKAADEETEPVQKDEYLTLSHVWLRTTKDTLSEWKTRGV